MQPGSSYLQYESGHSCDNNYIIEMRGNWKMLPKKEKCFGFLVVIVISVCIGLLYVNTFDVPKHVAIAKSFMGKLETVRGYISGTRIASANGTFQLNHGNVTLGVPNYIDYEELFPRRDPEIINRRLSQIYQLLEPFLQDLEFSREKCLNGNHSNAWLDVKTPVTVANGYESNYFHIVEKFPEVTTLFAKVSVTKMLESLVGNYYSYSTNHCSFLEAKSIYGQNTGKHMYNADCFDHRNSSAEALDPRPWNSVMLGNGLPEYFPVTDSSGTATLTFLHVIPNGIVKTTGDVYSNNLKIVPQRCSQDKSPKHPGSRSIYVAYEEVFTIAQFWGNGFFHFTVENLPRIMPYLPFLKKYPDIKIHVNSVGGFVVRLLGILGIEKRRLVTGNIRTQILYSPAGNPCGRGVTFTDQLLSLALRSQVQQQPEPRLSLVVIKRSTRRWFRHHSQIYALAQKLGQKYGLKVELFPDNPLPSLNESMAMFNRAMVVVGPHGAGISNLYFSEPGTALVEGLCYHDNRFNLCYRNLVQTLGHRYYGIALIKNCLDFTANDVGQGLNFFLENLLVAHK